MVAFQGRLIFTLRLWIHTWLIIFIFYGIQRGEVVKNRPKYAKSRLDTSKDVMTFWNIFKYQTLFFSTFIAIVMPVLVYILSYIYTFRLVFWFRFHLVTFIDHLRSSIATKSFCLLHTPVVHDAGPSFPTLISIRLLDSNLKLNSHPHGMANGKQFPKPTLPPLTLKRTYHELHFIFPSCSSAPELSHERKSFQNQHTLNFSRHQLFSSRLPFCFPEPNPIPAHQSEHFPGTNGH